MAAVESQMLALGTPAPAFALPDYGQGGTGQIVALADAAGEKATVVMFICNHCPFVRLVADELTRLANDYRGRGVGFVAVNANDAAAYPDDRPEAMTREARERGYPFPYLFDESQEVAKAYTAACTPDFYVFDADLRLAYRGQLDDARPGNGKQPDGRDIRAALDALLNGRRPDERQLPSIGCNIKWKPGNAPAYFSA